jgi:uncharacterized membrane protein
MKRSVPARPSDLTQVPQVPADRQADTKLNTAVSRVLSIGLLAAMVLLLAGVVLALARPDMPLPRRTLISGIPRALAAFEPGGFFELGLLVLVATPVARVVALGVGFARRRAWLFCGFSVFVLAVLVLSLFLGLSD